MTPELGRFRGPYADGPTPEALRVEAPSLHVFRLAELRRMLTVLVVLPGCLVSGLLRWLRHPRQLTRATAASEGVVRALMKLGPTYIKLGQLMASSPGLFPRPLADACQACLDDVPSFNAAQAREVIESDLGKTIPELFVTFDDVPLSAASIAQVHACVLPDGRNAVVKVQRPDIRQRMTTDLRITYRLARVLSRRFEPVRIANAVAIVEDLHAVTFSELNPVLEASRQQRFRDNIGAFGDNRWVTAPEVYWDYCGPNIICMERLYGLPVDSFQQLHRRGIDHELVLRRGVKVWIEAIAIHGPFHGDVHAGNMWVLDDGRAAFLDFGIVGELKAEWRRLVLDIMFTFLFDHDFTRIARSFRELGVFELGDGGGTAGGADSDATIAMRMQLIAGPLLSSGIGDINIGMVTMMLLDMGKDLGGRSPRELVLFGKQMAYFERYSKEFASAWVPFNDLFLFQHVFPDEVAKRKAELGIEFPDS